MRQVRNAEQVFLQAGLEVADLDILLRDQVAKFTHRLLGRGGILALALEHADFLRHHIALVLEGFHLRHHFPAQGVIRHHGVQEFQARAAGLQPLPNRVLVIPNQFDIQHKPPQGLIHKKCGLMLSKPILRCNGGLCTKSSLERGP